MARDYARNYPVSPTKNSLLVTAGILLIIQAASCQRVKVVAELEAYPSESVNLRCQFVDGGITKLTQVSWIWEPTEGQRDNIAVFHPTYGESFPESPFNGRVRFNQGTLTNPSITIGSLKMADAGRYTCEYATYPSGNEQGTTNLVMLARPKNSASPVIVQASTSSKPVVVAQCEAADGKPAATIKWMGEVDGTVNITSKKGQDGTVTVRSEYHLVPTAEDNGKEVTCMISQRTQDKPQTFPMKLSVEYPPTVSIVGYDNNWYIGRTNAILTCQATGNPAPTTVTWTAMSGRMPDTVQIDANKLIVRKVDEAVNTTFVCEVKNRLGVGKHQVTTAVIEQEQSKLTAGPSTAGIIGGIIGVVVFLAIVGSVIVLVRKRKQNAENGDGPPKHKPPPPVKTGSSTEMLNRHVTDSVTKELTETQPLSNVYYETSGEPVTDLDDAYDNTIGGGAANGGGPAVLEDSIQYDNIDKTLNDEALHPYSNADGHHVDEPPSATVARGESFVSAAMYV